MVPTCHRARRLWLQNAQKTTLVSACYHALSLIYSKKVWDQMFPTCHRALSFIDSKRILKVRDQIVPACHRARLLWMTKSAEDDVSLCVLSYFESYR